MQAAEIVRFFLAKDRVVRELAPENTDDQMTRIAIGRRDRIAWSLPIDGCAPLVVTHQDGAGFERQLFRDFEFLVADQICIIPVLSPKDSLRISSLSRIV